MVAMVFSLLTRWWRWWSLGVVTLVAIAFFQVPFSPTPAIAQSTDSHWGYASFPVENFQKYTSFFGYRTSVTNKSTQEFHRGLDLAAPMGSYIRNWWTGEITELSDHTACGTMITVQSGAWTHLYCHLQGYVTTRNGVNYLIDQAGGILLQQGQSIPVGLRIGRVGMTGRTTGPHLHWGLKYQGQYIDPLKVLTEMGKYQVSDRPENALLSTQNLGITEPPRA